MKWQIGKQEEKALAHRINIERISYERNKEKGTKLVEEEFRDYVEGRSISTAALENI